MKLDNALRDAVHQILQNAHAYEWSLQGLGMLRLYLSREVRLHVWDSRFTAGDVSAGSPLAMSQLFIPTRGASSPTSSSRVRCGSSDTTRMRVVVDRAYRRQLIQCGPEGCAVGAPEDVRLYRGPIETYSAGSSYGQAADEIHESLPTPGTVTVVERTFNEDTEHAFVYFQGDTWGEATPRPATPEEVTAITGLALRRWGRAA